MNNVAFTMAKNEAELLPIWLKYYQPHFEKIFVLNDGSTDGSIEKCQKDFEFEVIELRKTGESYLDRRVREVGGFFHKLALDYDWVLFADVDEFVVPDPEKYKGLRDYIEKAKGNMVTCTGWEIIQMEGEKPVDFSNSLLAQRKKLVKVLVYNKTILSRVPIMFKKGFHCPESFGIEGREQEFMAKAADPALIMIHLQRMDLDLYQKRRTIDKRGLERFYADRGKEIDIPERFKKLF
ncbi:MAG: glycosyltransferase family 2 protein [Candidatus Hodarchaeota archaeon]